MPSAANILARSGGGVARRRRLHLGYIRWKHRPARHRKGGSATPHATERGEAPPRASNPIPHKAEEEASADPPPSTRRLAGSTAHRRGGGGGGGWGGGGEGGAVASRRGRGGGEHAPGEGRRRARALASRRGRGGEAGDAKWMRELGFVFLLYCVKKMMG